MRDQATVVGPSPRASRRAMLLFWARRTSDGAGLLDALLNGVGERLAARRLVRSDGAHTLERLRTHRATTMATSVGENMGLGWGGWGVGGSKLT